MVKCISEYIGFLGETTFRQIHVWENDGILSRYIAAKIDSAKDSEARGFTYSVHVYGNTTYIVRYFPDGIMASVETVERLNM